MGVDINALKFLLAAKADGTDFGQTIMIGRQRIYLDRARLEQLLFREGKLGSIAGQTDATSPYAESILRCLGAAKVDSLDISDYEGASILHDMNTPLPAHLHGAYSAVVEAGTLEHLFNFPIALRNCLELVAPGGHLICCTVANNFCGHGFYQFSPELFFRALSEENGFQIEAMIACDAFRESEWYRVTDPAKVRTRVQIFGPYAVMLLVRARRISVVQPFTKLPQQSDYSNVWSGEVEQHADHLAPPKRPLSLSLSRLAGALLPGKIIRKIRHYRSQRQYPPSLFQKCVPPAEAGSGKSQPSLQ